MQNPDQDADAAIRAQWEAAARAGGKNARRGFLKKLASVALVVVPISTGLGYGCYKREFTGPKTYEPCGVDEAEHCRGDAACASVGAFGASRCLPRCKSNHACNAPYTCVDVPLQHTRFDINEPNPLKSQKTDGMVGFREALCLTAEDAAEVR